MTIQQNSISLSHFAKSLTPEERVASKQMIKYYDMLAALKKARLKIGYTQQELADKTALPRTTITKVESGKHNPTIETLIRIASAMNKQIRIQLI